MRTILIRAGKSPFEIVDHATNVSRNTLGTNVGNLVFAEATQKHLKTEDTTLAINGYSANPDKADEINEKYDAFVLPFANAFRVSFEDHLNKFTRLIRKLKIPTIVVGVGAQSNLDYSFDKMKPVNDSVTSFVKAVLDHSASIGVRGEFTHDYLRQLGFKDVDVIGCPSMFMWGKRLEVKKKVDHLDANSKVSINISPYVKRMGNIVTYHHKKYENLVYIPQNTDTLKQLLWGEPLKQALEHHQIPVRTSHPLFRENKVRFFVDPRRWIEYLEGLDFSFGTRIHGNITSILAGTPAVVLAHDSRTLELARYFEMPHRRMDSLPFVTDAADLYEEACFERMHAGHEERFRTYVSFLEKNGLDHIYSADQPVSSFDARLKTVPLPGSVDCLAGRESRILAERVGWLYRTQARDRTDSKKRADSLRNGELKGLKRSIKDLNERLATIEEELVAVREQSTDSCAEIRPDGLDGDFSALAREDAAALTSKNWFRRLID